MHNSGTHYIAVNTDFFLLCIISECYCSVFQTSLPVLDNPFSQRLREIIDSFRAQRSRYMKVNFLFSLSDIFKSKHSLFCYFSVLCGAGYSFKIFSVSVPVSISIPKQSFFFFFMPLRTNPFFPFKEKMLNFSIHQYQYKADEQKLCQNEIVKM